MTLRDTLLMMPVLLSLPASALAEATRATAETAPMTQDDPNGGGPLSPDGTLADILNHPAFAGFAERILPWDNRTPDPALPLADISSLLPYHSAIDTGTVVAGLNRMIRDAASTLRPCELPIRPRPRPASSSIAANPAPPLR